MNDGVPGVGLACSVSGQFCKVVRFLYGSVMLGCVGAGEHIMRVNLARTIGDALTASPHADPHQILRWALVDVFWSALLFDCADVVLIACGSRSMSRQRDT